METAKAVQELENDDDDVNLFQVAKMKKVSSLQEYLEIARDSN